MRRSDPLAGFTFIEVLAALAITAALVAVVLPFAGRLATRWWVGEAAVEAADGWMQALARLGDDVSQAVPLSIPQGARVVTAFQGGSGFVQFVRPALGHTAGTALETVRYEIRVSAAGSAMVRRARRFAPDDFFGEPKDAGTPTTLLDGPFRFRFATIGRDNAPRASWGPQGEMPVGIELSVVATKNKPAPPGPILLPVVARPTKPAPPGSAGAPPGAAGEAPPAGAAATPPSPPAAK